MEIVEKELIKCVYVCVFPPSVSQMVIEEVSVLQTQLEIEKSCRENAEALATKVRRTQTHTAALALSASVSGQMG